jgi:hypothetical protein
MDALTLATAFKNLWYKTSDIIWKYLEMEGKKYFEDDKWYPFFLLFAVVAHFFIRIICRGSQTLFFF